MSDERGASILHIHKSCGQQMHVTSHCSECGEAVSARDIKLEVGEKWRGNQEGFLPEKFHRKQLRCR
jgi:hypothetical protein